MLVTILFVGLIVAALALHAFYIIFKRLKCSFKDKSVIITGGSKGIGKCIAIEMAKEGALSIVIMARRINELKEAKAEIERNCVSKKTKVVAVSCDVTDKIKVKEAIDSLKTEHGVDRIDSLFLVHGAAIPGYFVEQDEKDFEFQMNLNYFGSLYVTKAVLPHIMRNPLHKNDKHIVFVSSAICLCTFIGYSSYAPTKFAVRGLAESLESELQGHGIKVHLSIPSDTDTEGFGNENLTKPKETLEISGAVKLEQPSQPAKAIIRDIKKNKFWLFDSFDFELLVAIGQGITPRGCPFLSIVYGIIGIIASYFINFQFTSISYKHAKERETRFNSFWNK
ncbi:3-dehydrosphinganine reductase [Acrasis kona]|uniref:3-dehydrosphinganine reductase n=1 Tax=Acrasis kona TaxID=1008807 RepID=A0AAW2ZGU2_9EUKA